MEIDPRKNPAVLDTATWDPESAWGIVSAIEESHWQSIEKAVLQGNEPETDNRCAVYAASFARRFTSVYFLAGLPDGQQAFIELGTTLDSSILGEPIGVRTLGGGMKLALYSADASIVDRYVGLLRPDKGPKALGATPRLGVGSRMSTAAWPGVWQAMGKCNFSANPIQNSVREVNLLDDILAGRPPRLNYLANFGSIEEGHTGSTFEGLWVAGVLEALKADSPPSFCFANEAVGAYGADADHITVRRGADEIERAKRVIEAARRYTFFTLDVSDLLDYGATGADSESASSEQSGRRSQMDEVLAYHAKKAGGQYRLDKASIRRLAGKYFTALNAVQQLSDHIISVRNGEPFDLELSIDETPSGIDAFASLTTQVELIFLALELQRRAIPVTHIAPNFGIEKGYDYRGCDGLSGLEERIRGLYDISCRFGLMLDCHSGDDLKSATRRVVGRATQGHNHFKVSPALQVIFAETLNDVEPEQFRFWWDDTLYYARRQAAAGSGFAADCIRRYEAGGNPRPSPEHAVFHYYSFASVGKRDRSGKFIHREKFYNLSAGFYREYQRRVCSYLCEVAADVFNRG